MAMNYFSTWPFPEDEIVMVHWISSPVVGRDGRKTCQVYFRTSSGAITPLTMAWGFLPELWIGRAFVNGAPQHSVPTKESSPVIYTANATDIRYGKAADLIPKHVYLLEQKEIFHEWCCSFLYGGYTYIIPCVELARVLYARNSVLANQLLSTGGLEDLIDLSSWRVEEETLMFDFAADVPKISQNFANHIVSIYGNSMLRGGWNHTYTQFAATETIKTQLPKLAGLKLRCSGVETNKTRFVVAAELISIPYPYDRIMYGPEKLRRTGKGAEPKGVMKSRDSAEDIDVDLSGTSAKRAGATNLEQTSEISLFARVKASRKTRTDDMAPSAKVIKVNEPNEIYSPGDIIGGGKLSFVNFERQYLEEVPADADFELFCEALNQLILNRDVRLLGVEYDQLPAGKWVSVLNLQGHRPRRYVCAVLEKGNTVWIALEICNKDGYSGSTLFIRSNGREKELVNQTIDKFMKNNGSWPQIELSDTTRYRTLDHHITPDKGLWKYPWGTPGFPPTPA